MSGRSKPHYSIGIDLGTTNSVLAYLDLKQPERGPQVLPLPQWETADSYTHSDLLPSFLCALTADETAAGFQGDEGPPASALDGWKAGIFARQQMALRPGRVVASAKSWLCHMDIDRTAPILPWKSEEISDEKRLSPIQVSSVYLAYFKNVWNRVMAGGRPEADFENQEVVITVPASFDEVAQQLTLEAARLAGFPDNIRLIEEPQAAFYAWLDKGRNINLLADLLEQQDEKVVRVVVCDIGGGTTDLSLFEVCGDSQAPNGLGLKRLAVSDHLLLGGDNIDLTLAYLLEQKLTGRTAKLSGRQWNQLLAQARDFKERLLRDAVELEQTEFTVTLSGTGSGLFGSTKSAKISADEVRHCVLEGFFPICAKQDRPQRKAGGLREWGLPYAADSAVTRHLAAFLDGQQVDAVLYNGGSVTPDFLRQRLTDLLADWQEGYTPTVLASDSLAMAVAKGAAKYGYLQLQPKGGERITGGHAHALYLEVKQKKKGHALVCVLPHGMEADQTVSLHEQTFDLLVNQAARFQCFYSSRRYQDQPGTVVEWNEKDFHSLPPLQTAVHLPANRPAPPNNRLRVSLECSLNELGLLQLYCVEENGPGRWRLDFNLRKSALEEQETELEVAPLVPAERIEQAKRYILSLYGKKKDPALPDFKPNQLLRQLETALGVERGSWDSLTLRSLWPTLAQGMARRNRGPGHELSWLNLAGYALRPGYGVEADEARMEELWRLFSMGMAFPNDKNSLNHWCILWRRVAGGLNAGRQEKLFSKLQAQIKTGNDTSPELLRLVGSLERLPVAVKQSLVKRFLAGYLRTKHREPYAWALGRLLSRTPLYAGPDSILPPNQVEKAFNQLKDLDWRSADYPGLVALFALAARRTELREDDLSEQLREAILGKMLAAKARPEQLRVVRDCIPIEELDKVAQFGESLPAGLFLVDL